MNDEERRLITGFVERVAGANRQAPSAWTVGQPAAAQQQQPLPPVDPEADRLLADLFARYPEARYRLTQTAFVQEHVLAESQNRIQQLQYELERARREAQAAQSGGGGFLGGLFGGGRPAHQQPLPPQPQPVHAPGYQPGMFGRQGRSGMGFLGTAAAAAAGVGGGMLAANAIGNLMGSGGHGAAQAAESPAATAAESPLPGPQDNGGWGQSPQQDDGDGWGDEER